MTVQKLGIRVTCDLPGCSESMIGDTENDIVKLSSWRITNGRAGKRAYCTTDHLTRASALELEQGSLDLDDDEE